MTISSDRATLSGSRENLYTLACNRQEKERKVKYISKKPPKTTKEDIELIERFYEQINRNNYNRLFPQCCGNFMEGCFASDLKGWYCKRCFKWIKFKLELSHPFGSTFNDI